MYTFKFIFATWGIGTGNGDGVAFMRFYNGCLLSSRSYIVMSMDTKPRRTEDGIEILPWEIFLDCLWSNEIINS